MNTKTTTFFRVALLLLVVFATYKIIIREEPWLLSTVNLIFHEAGHWVFVFFGETITALGGSLLQVLVPLICMVSFLRQHDLYAAAIMLWWCGDNIASVSIYMGDANALVLPLLGDGDHDWNTLFATWGVLIHAEFIAQIFWYLAITVMTLSILWALTITIKKSEV